MDNPEETTGRGRVQLGILLAVVVFVAFFLRLAAIDHGLPFVVGPDEGFEIHRALKLGLGEFDLERIAKGGFFYLLFVEYGLYFVFLRLTELISDASQFAEHFATDITPFWMIARITHAAIGALTAVLTYLVGRALYHPVVGTLAAAGVAVSSLHVSRSLYVGVDVPMGLLVLIVLLLAYRWSDRDSLGFSMLLGACFGLAVMTKLTAITLLFPILVAARRPSTRWWRSMISRNSLAAFVTASVVFVVGNPGFVLKFRTLVVTLVGNTLLGVEADNPTEVFAEGGSGENLWLYYSKALSFGMGLPWLLLAAAGAVYALVRRSRPDLLLISFVIPFFALIAGSQSKHLYYGRYVLPLIPVLSVLAAALLWAVLGRLTTRPGKRLALAAVAVAVLLAPTTARSSAQVASLKRGDTRIEARKWIEANIAPGSSIFLLGNPLVDTAPNLSLPLRDTDENVRALADAIRTSEPTQARFLDYRRTASEGVRFDLHTARHFESVPTLRELRRRGVEFYALVGDRFDATLLARDTKHSNRILASRRELREALSSDAAELVYRVDPKETRLAGPWVEIYRAASRPPMTE